MSAGLGRERAQQDNFFAIEVRARLGEDGAETAAPATGERVRIAGRPEPATTGRHGPDRAAGRVAWRHDAAPSAHPHQIADEHRADGRARPSRCCSTRRSSPIVDMVLHPPRRRATRPSPPTGRVTFARAERRRLRARSRTTGRNPLADQSTDKFAGLDDERAHPHPAPRPTTPTRSPTSRSPSSSTRPPRPTSACSTRPRTTGRTRAATSASTARSAIVQARAPMVIGGKGVKTLGVDPARGPARRRRARRSPRCSAARRAPTARYLAVPGRRRARRRARPGRAPAARRRLPVRRHQLQRALRHVRARRGAERRAPHRDGRRVRARRDVVAARRSRSRTTRRSSPARTPATTASSTTRGSTARRGEQVITNSQATWPWCMKHLTPGHRVDPRRRAPHVARRVHRVGQRAVRHRRRLLDVRLLPPRRGPADPQGPVRPAAHDRAVRAPVEGLLVVVGRRPHGHRPGARHPRRATTATSATRCRASCGATSRSPTPRCTKAARTRRWRPRRSATATAGSARSSTRSSSAACSTTARSCSSPTTAWRRTTRRASGDWDVALRGRGHRRPRRGVQLPVPRESEPARAGSSAVCVRSAPAERTGRCAMRKAALAGALLAAAALLGVRQQRQGRRDRRHHDHRRACPVPTRDFSEAPRPARPSSRSRSPSPTRSARRRRTRRTATGNTRHDQRRHARCSPRRPRGHVHRDGSGHGPPVPRHPPLRREQQLHRGSRSPSRPTPPRSPTTSAHTSTKTIAGHDAACFTISAPDFRGRQGSRRRGRREPEGHRRRTASTVTTGALLENTFTDASGDLTDNLDGDEDRGTHRAGLPAARDADHHHGPRRTGDRARRRRRSVADVPEAQAARRRELTGRAAGRGRAARPCISPGRRLARPDLHERADDRAHHLPAERVGADLVAQHAVAFVDPARLEHPRASATSPPGPCGRTRRSRARRRTGRPRAAARAGRAARHPPHEAVAERIGHRPVEDRVAVRAATCAPCRASKPGVDQLARRARRPRARASS